VTLIDEEMLSEALREAAATIDLPERATERIVAAARTAPVEARSFHPGTVIPRRGRGRTMLVAAVVLLVSGITLSFTLTKGSPTRSVARGPASATSTPHSASSSASTPTAPNATGSPLRQGSSKSPSPSNQGSNGSATTPPLPSGAVGQSAKVVSKGTVDLTIGDGKLQSVLGKLTDLALANGGFVASTQAQVGPGGTGSSSSGTVVLQVPQPSFSTVLTQVQRIGHATSVTTSASDVTGQYVDLQARISALQASRQQYLTIMAHTTSVGDILAVQSQLDALQSQIEQLQGQLDLLNSQTTYGTLTVSLTEAGHQPLPPPAPTSGVIKAWHDGINGFVSGFEGLIRIAGPAVFALLCLAGLALLGWWTWRTANRRRL
jgi:hypothetical protein